MAVTARASEEGGVSAAPPPTPSSSGWAADRNFAALRERHAWDLGKGWYLYFVGTMTAQAVLALVLDPNRTGMVSVALLATITVLYMTFGRWLSRKETYPAPGAGVFILVSASIAAVAIHLNSNLGFVLFALAPMFYMVGTLLYGSLAVGIILIGPNLAQWLYGDLPFSQLATSLGFSGAVLAFALWYSHWFSRVVVQSYERHELINQLRESRNEAARLSEEAGAMAEREHLGREMHDTLAQGFTSIITLTQAVESEMDTQPDLARRHLVLMRETASENLAEARAMVAARQPVRLDSDSLDATLERISDQLGAELGISTRSRIMGEPHPLPNDLQVCVLRTAQEALANIRKHSGAASAELALAYTDVGVVLTVTDDGQGFSLAEAPTGNGLANMRHRAEHVGGALEIDTVGDGGTVIRLSLPHEQPAQDPEETSASPAATAEDSRTKNNHPSRSYAP